MSQGHLDFFDLTPPALARPPRRSLFADLDCGAASFPRLAAERIAMLEERAEIERALAKVPPETRTMVETLAVMGLALRIARLPELAARQAALAAIPEALSERVKAHVKRYYVTKPWTKRETA
jgi:hypothetical protein